MLPDKITVCSKCDLVVSFTHNVSNDTQFCPRCSNRIATIKKESPSNIAIISFSAIIFLLISILQPFMSISSLGLKSEMSLLSIITILERQWGGLLYSFLFFTFFAPLYVLVTTFLVCGFNLKPNVIIGKLYSFCHKMCMVDVFVLGIIVSLIKLTSLADVSFYVGFYTTFIFSLLLMWVNLKFRPNNLWELIKPQDKLDLEVGKNAKDLGYKCCHECGYVYKASSNEEHCPRCHQKNYFRKKDCISKSFCLLLSALILYLPSNLYPVMYTDFMFSSIGSNIIDGVVAMWDMKSYFVAIVILVASIFIPAFKIISLAYIIWISKNKDEYNKLNVSRLYRIVLFIGRWSLIDVYVVIIMSSVVRIGSILSIYPGFAIVCFCSVVIITLFSAEAFDERLIWDKKIHGTE